MADEQQTIISPREKRNADPDRLLMFTDGVFAIIITVMVIDIEVPDFSSGQSLLASMADIRSSVVVFVISFLIVGTYWAWHRSAFAQVRYIDLNTIWLNLLFLLPVSMIPFATATLGEDSQEPAALYLYGAVLISATLLRVILDSYLRRHPGLLWETPTESARRLSRGVAIAPILVYAAAMAIAGAVPWLSLLLYFSLPIMYFGAVALLKTDARTRSDAQDLG